MNLGSAGEQVQQLSRHTADPHHDHDLRRTAPNWRRHQSVWMIARMFPSESLNHAAFAPPAMMAPAGLRWPGMLSYCSKTTPRFFSSTISRSTSSTAQNAWLAFDVPALSVRYR